MPCFGMRIEYLLIWIMLLNVQIINLISLTYKLSGIIFLIYYLSISFISCRYPEGGNFKRLVFFDDEFSLWSLMKNYSDFLICWFHWASGPLGYSKKYVTFLYENWRLLTLDGNLYVQILFEFFHLLLLVR